MKNTFSHEIVSGNNSSIILYQSEAESRTEEKDIMVKVVVNLINKDNK